MGISNDIGVRFSIYWTKAGLLRGGLAIFLLLMLAVFQARSAVFYVTVSSDASGLSGDSGGFTLRDAVILANSKGGTNTIILTNNTYQLTLVGADEDAALSGDLDVTHGNLTIVGASTKKVTIDATGLGDRVFQVFPGTQLTLSNLVITGGVAAAGIYGSSGGSGENGGGIYNGGTLALYDSVVAGNTSGMGGGASSIMGSGGNGGCGGGIYNTGALVLHNSTVNANRSGDGVDGARVEGNEVSNSQGGNGGDGGGIYNLGILILDTCIISGNTNGVGGLMFGNGGNGAGIYNVGTLSMTNTMVAGNFSGSDGSASGSGGSGGGIYSVGLSTLNDCAISGNSGGSGGGASDSNSPGGGIGGNGGGIFNGGPLIMNNCTVGDNSGGAGAAGGSIWMNGYGSIGWPAGAGGNGGGIYNTNSVVLNSCTISGNAGGTGGLGGNGQGYFSGNSGGAGGNGGGIYNGGNITLKLCTVSGNLSGFGGNGGRGSGGGNGGAGGNGGGIFSGGITALIACTVSDNSGVKGGDGGYNFGRFSPTGGSGGAGGGGGGVFEETNSQSVDLSNTLIALNRTGAGGLGGPGLFPPPPPSTDGANGSGLDMSGNFVSQGYNLVGQADGSAGLTNGINNDLVGSTNAPINPLLGSLQNNGGPTFTHALLFGSPAMDQGSSLGLTTDQRGHPRPHDYFSIPNATGGNGSDIGAFEADTPILSIRKLNNGASLIWETNCPGYTLEFTTSLTATNSWTPVLDTPSITGYQYQVTNGFTGADKFFRLRSN